MIRTLLVDDEPPARERLRRLLHDTATDVEIIGEAGNAAEARDAIDRARPDLVFLDVEMPEVRGTALAATLPEPRPFIVFATAYEHYALDAIAVDATDYLLKPVSRARLTATLERVRARLARHDVVRDVIAASRVQSHMWPGTLPVIPGFECAAASLPARGVGGDFYDAFAVPAANGWGFMIGDASGKGVAAGLVASAVQARVHTAARLAGLAPEDLMTAVDRDVHATTDGARYATAIYGLLDTATHAMTIVNAGHTALHVLAPQAAAPAVIRATGPALGLVEAGRFESQSVTLSPGTVMLASTDGVTDALNDRGQEFGEVRLAEWLVDNRERPAPQLCTALLDTVRDHRGARQDQDDVTVLVIKAMRP